MSSLLERARPKKSAPTSSALPASLPQVNLLPPTIHAKRALGRIKRMLAYGLVAVLALVVIGWFGASAQRSSQEQRLADAQSESTRLIKSQAQYAEAPKVLGKLGVATDAREQGFANDVTWLPYIHAIVASLPSETVVTSISFAGSTPMLLPAPATDPLQAPSVGQIAFTTRSPKHIDTADWISNLNSVPGFSDAWVSDVKVASKDDQDKSYFEVTSTVQVTDAAYSGRFETKDN